MWQLVKLLYTVFNKTFPGQLNQKGLEWPYKNIIWTLVSVEMSAIFHLYHCLFCYHSHGSSHHDSCLHRRNHLCFLCNDGQTHDLRNAVHGYNVYLLGRDENSVWLFAVTVYLGAMGSLKTGWKNDYGTELMAKILMDPGVENQISLHMTSVSKHCSSLLVSENFLNKRKISEVSVLMESYYPPFFRTC